MMSPAVKKTFQKSKTLNNKYICGDEIGKGAHGKVYKGLDLENGDFVAIKQVSLENIGQHELGVVMQEIELLKNLNHENIVKYLGSVKTKSHLHIILEFMENGSLENIINPNKFGPFPEPLAAVYIAQVLKGLVYLHEQGVIHRDIKGANILMTKEGLVKLADFGVAMKLPVGHLKSQIVVGTPYWMAPEVIDLSGVCTASDIWSVGSTLIELLTGDPPYFHVAPMTALYRIVMDERPPIPDGLSPAITDFLHQCFKKDPRHRPDAKTLLSHPWIQESRRPLHTLRPSGSLRNIEEVSSVEAELSTSEQGHSAESSSTEKDKLEEDQVLTFSNEKSLRKSSALTNNHDVQAEAQTNGDAELRESAKRSFTSRKFDGKESSAAGEHVKQNFAQKSKDQCLRKAVSGSISSEGNDLNRFSEQPGDASLDDLFHPLNYPAAEASTSSSLSKGFKDKVHEEYIFDLQGVEFSRLQSSLRSDEPEDVTVSACQKLTTLFHQRPDLKNVFITEHGLLPLVELLEVPRTHVVCSALKVLNQIIQDNTEYQENACLAGLIPVVMNFALPDHPMEIRTEAAYFFQQLCRSSLLTLQMFIVCHGIPILVGFLEADYATHRDMVHIAIDGLWQVLKLQKSTSRNDFCRIAAKNGILLRLINALYFLNEGARLASRSRFHPALQEPSITSALLYPESTAMEAPSASKMPDSKNEPSRSDVDVKQRSPNAANKKSTDKATKSVEVASNGCSMILPNSIRKEKFRPLLSLRHKEPPSRHFSCQLGNLRHLPGIAKNRCILPLLNASHHKKTDGLEFLKAEFAEVSCRGREYSNMHALPRNRHKAANKNLAHLPSSGKHSSLGLASHSGSCVLLGSGVLHARPESSTLNGNKNLPHLPTSGMVYSSLGLPSHSGSSVLSDSGVLHAKPGCSTSPWNVHVEREYLRKVADLLLEFAAADSGVRSFMCSQSFLSRLFQMFNKVEPPILLKLLKCINHLSTDPNCLEHLQRADAIRNLIPNLALKEGSLVSFIHLEVLNALFNLCKINKKRQNQAAEYGIIPHLLEFIMSGSPLRQYALPLLCDMAYASRHTRDQLRAHGALDVYLSLLEDEIWCVTALDSVAVCLAHDKENRKVEVVLLKKDSVQKLVKFFRCCPENHFLNILEPFLKIITKSPEINATLAVSGLTPLLITRLDNPDAMIRLNLLKMIKAVYEHHPRPEQLIVEHNLPEKLQYLIEERRSGQSSANQVLVKQLATSLLKALHIPTVL